MLLKRLLLSSCLLFTVFPALAQQSSTPSAPVTKDPQAVSLAITSLAALSGNAQISDITLTGTVTRIAGSDVEEGNFTLEGLGTGDSRMDLNLVGGLTSEIRNQDSGAPEGFFIKPGASASPYPQHNCLTTAVWFFPALSSLAQTSDPTVAVTFIGQETKLGVAVNHIRFNTQLTQLSTSDNALLGQLSQADFYLDSSSNLPVAIVFNTHPDNNALTNINEEIDFASYQVVKGVQVPFRIQKYLNGNLFLDLTVQNVAVNSGLTDSVFASN
jgi:hypothetical protein